MTALTGAGTRRSTGATAYSTGHRAVSVAEGFGNLAARGTGASVTSGRAAATTSRNDRARFIAGQTSEAVITEREFKERIVLRAANIRAGTGGDDDGEQDPPSGADHHRGERDNTINQTPPEFRRRCDQNSERKARENKEHLHLLSEEAEADAHTGERRFDASKLI
ncbi:MAG: hypothetical protein J6575_08380 [Bifidobacterium sp.]|nr:hypothetical protein [Bifidobacterium sp.]